MADPLALAQQHMSAQVRRAARTQAALAVAFGRTMDPSNLDRSFVDFSRYALPLIGASRADGIAIGDRYYLDAKTQAGLTGELPVAEIPSMDLARMTLDLQVNGPVKVKAALTRGEQLERGLLVAQAATLGVAKRLILEAPRQRLISLSENDKTARGWARVSDGSPCAFCAMLVSRGPVYSEGGGYFQAHNGCGCSLRPVFRGDKTGGWSPQAREYQKLWREHGGDAKDLADFRHALANPAG